MELNTLKPAVSRRWLMVIAGLVWSLVGIGLGRLAFRWLVPLNLARAAPFGVTGLASAWIAYRYAFSRIAQKNIDRLARAPDTACIFAFQAWKSYFIIVFMVSLGILLRHSPIPKPYLAAMYIAIGGALLLGGGRYWVWLWNPFSHEEPSSPSGPPE